MKEGVRFSPIRNENRNIVGWEAGVEGGGKAVAPALAFPWVPHERSTWPWRYAELKKEIRLSDGPIYPQGTTIKIVMVSRLGDVGITNKLDTDVGYFHRIDFDKFDEFFENCRMEQ